MKNYRDLERQLVAMREASKGLEDPEEEALLEKMDEAWRVLTTEQKAQILGEAPKSRIVDSEGNEVVLRLIEKSDQELKHPDYSPLGIVSEFKLREKSDIIHPVYEISGEERSFATGKAASGSAGEVKKVVLGDPQDDE